MDLIYTEPYDPIRGIVELGYLSNCEIDIELGTIASSARNDFEVILHEKELTVRKGALIYADDGSEIGGMVYGIKVNTGNDEITLKCKLWRGMLMDHVIKPEAGEDYYTFNGDANTVLADMINNAYDGLIVASDQLSHISVMGKIRYSTVLEACEDMLAKVNARLNITFTGSQVICEALEINDLSDQICLDNDYGIPMIAEDSDSGYNHIIALGQGNLKDRQVIELWRTEDSMISDDSSAEGIPAGLTLRSYVYDYSSVETPEELERAAVKKLNELGPTKKLEIEPGKLAVELGDIIRAMERTTGISMKKQVTRKIIKGQIYNGVPYLTTEYKAGD